MRILVTGARGRADAVTTSRLRRDEHEEPGAPTASSWSYVVVDSLADLFAPGELDAADTVPHDSRVTS